MGVGHIILEVLHCATLNNIFPLDGDVAYSLWPETECYCHILDVLWNHAGLEG